MDWEKKKPTDVVMAAAAKIAEDMVHGTVDCISNVADYHTMFKNMAGALEGSIKNIKKHILMNKWNSPDGKKIAKKQIAQIRSISTTCLKLQSYCYSLANSAIEELERMEADESISEIVGKIDLRPDDDEQIDDI